MIELQPDFLLPAEAVKAGGVAFDLKVGHFQSDCLAGLAVVPVRNRSRFGDTKLERDLSARNGINH